MTLQTTNNLQPEEEKALSEFKELLNESQITQQIPSLQKVSDETLIMCLLARRLDITRAFDLLKRYVPWREEKIQTSSVSDLYSELTSTKIQLLPEARDLEGRVLIAAFPRFYLPSETSPINLVKLLIYILDKALLSNLEVQRKGFTIIIDGTHTSLSNFDRKLPGALLDAITNRYPARIGHILLINTPWFFPWMWTIIRPLLSTVVASKLKILTSPGKLKEYVSEENLLPLHGGSYLYNHEAWIAQQFTVEGLPIPPELQHFDDSSTNTNTDHF